MGLTFLKFITVGGFGFGFDILITYILKDRLNVHKYVSNTVGFILGIAFRYIFNRIWTFQSNDPEVAVQFLKFMSIGVVGLGIVTAVIYLLHDKLGMKFYPAKIIAMIVFMFWNFSANYFWTFAE